MFYFLDLHNILPLHQATPTESTVSHTASNGRARSSRGTQRGTSEHTLPFRSSSSTSLSQAPPTTADCTTLVDHNQGGGVGGAKGVDPNPVVLNSVYTNGLGWASQVPKITIIVEVRESKFLILPFLLVVYW